jgi:hypothetical protein
MARLQPLPATLGAAQTPPADASPALPASPSLAAVPEPAESSPASPLTGVPASFGVPANSSEGLPVPSARELSAGLSAQTRPNWKHSLDQAWPAAAAVAGGTLAAALPAAVANVAAEPAAGSPTATAEKSPSPNTLPPAAATPSPAAPGSLGQPALEQRLYAATAHRPLFQAATAESRHSTASPVQPLATGSTGAARYGAGELGEPATQPGGGKAAELAFGARLVPAAGPAEAPANDAPGPQPVSSTTPARPSGGAPLNGATAQAASPAAAVTAPDPASDQTGDSAETISTPPATPDKGETGAAERFRKSETSAASSWEGASAARLSADAAYAPAAGSTSASSRSERAAAAEPRAAAAPEPAADAEPAKPPSAAHNIQLDVNGGDRRVEVRLTERSGEVEVAVRTPDAHLASALREDLPALSSRLAESGFRAETWHPASAVSSGPGEGHKLAEPSAGGTPQDANGRSRQNGGQPQGDSQPRQPKTSEQQADQKSPGKDFAWLMSSLR